MRKTTDSKTWLELIGTIGERNVDMARIYGKGILTYEELVTLVSQPAAEAIRQYFIMN